MSLERFCRHNEKRLRKGEEEVGKGGQGGEERGEMQKTLEWRRM